MPHLDWQWEPRERINLSECPHDDWEAIYHWLEANTDGEVVIKIDEDLNYNAYICNVDG